MRSHDRLLTPYVYVNNRPTVLADPTGMRGENSGWSHWDVLGEMFGNPMASYRTGCARMSGSWSFDCKDIWNLISYGAAVVGFVGVAAGSGVVVLIGGAASSGASAASTVIECTDGGSTEDCWASIAASTGNVVTLGYLAVAARVYQAIAAGLAMIFSQLAFLAEEERVRGH